jgi:hypothetical protein
VKESEKLRRQQKRQRGECLQCSDKALDNKAYCERHLLQKRESERKRIKAKDDRSECRRCTKPAIVGKRLCKDHYIDQQRRSHEWRIQRIKNGGCRNCSRDALAGFSFCGKHLLKRRELGNEKNLKKSQSKECVTCSNKALPGHIYCEKHLIKHREKSRTDRARKKEKGECIICSEKVKDGHTHCERHLNERREKRKQKKQEKSCVDCSEIAIDGYSHCLKHLEKAKLSKLKYQKTHMENGLCIFCSEPTVTGKRHCVIHLQVVNNRSKERNKKEKQLVINHYEGECAICGEHQIEFLTIDHIHDDGKEYREKRGVGSKQKHYTAIIADNFPESLQVLCFNHNWKKEMERRRNNTVYPAKNPKKQAQQRAYASRVKKEVINFYAGQCVCCGENDIDVLNIDHINQDGSILRRLYPSQNKIYFWLRKNGYPDDYQVLCCNCNRGSFFFNGVCPHQLK